MGSPFSCQVHHLFFAKGNAMSATGDQAKMVESWDLAFGLAALASSTVDRVPGGGQAVAPAMRPVADQAAIDASWDRAFAQAQAGESGVPTPPTE